MKVHKSLRYHLLVLLLCVCWAGAGAQNQTVSIHMKNASLKQVFKAIESQTTYRFSYRSGLIDNRSDITLNHTKASVPSVLNEALKGRSLKYSIVSEKSIVITDPASPQSSSSSTPHSVKGKVVDENGEPVVGATVREKGTLEATITDVEGDFSISVAPGAVLEISYISYKPAQVTVVSGKSNYNVTLQEDNQNLNEVVVVGYGTQKKVNLSGSVAQLDGKQLENRPINNVSAGLQGLMPGITVTGTAGAPGMDGGSIHVRGVGTLNTSTPYILVDGVETGNLNSLDPQDIASISVLKDASSAAIYGSKAANGVILITTKRGTTGKPQITYTGNVGFSNATALMDRMGSADYAYWYNKALERTDKQARWTDDDLQKFRDGSDPYGHPNTDWYDLAYKTGWQQRHNVSLSGGNDFVKYLGSLGYLKSSSVLPNAGREQVNARTNLDINLSKSITVHLNLSYIRNNYTDASSAYYGGSSDQVIRLLNRISPWVANRLEDGGYGTVSDGNPIAWLDSGMKVRRNNRNFTGQAGLDWQILPDLQASVTASYIDNSQRYNYFQNFIQYNANKASDPNQLTVENATWDRTNFDALLNYTKTVADVHNFKLMGGWHTERYKYYYDYTYRKNFPNNEVTDMNAGDASTQQNKGYSRDLRMVSYFGRLNYDFAGRYLFEANFRADASSRFAEGHRWGYFPSFSAAWRISEESFMAGTRSWLDNLKLRASWGKLGNQEALNDYYPWMNTYNTSATYPFGGALNSGYYQKNYHLADITWEKATTWGVGIDFAFLQSFTGSIDFYNRKTTGILMDVSAPAEFALGAYKDNIGSMKNTGVELSLAYNKQLNKDWRIDLSGNFAYNKNKVLDLGAGTEYISDGNTRHAVGHQYGEFFMYKWSGRFFNSQEEADAYTAKYGNPFGQKFMAGDLVYEDADGDGKLNAADREYIGKSAMPSITYAFNIGATWRDFDLQMTWQGVEGTRHVFNREVLGEFSGDASHPSTLWAESWTETNHNAKMPRAFETATSSSDMQKCMSTFWLWNTGYLRLKTLQIGYSLPKALLAKCGIQRVRFYYSGENLLTFDHLPFKTDPETTSERGSSYPLLRSHSIGVNISF